MDMLSIPLGVEINLQKNENIQSIEIVVKNDKKNFNSIYYFKLFN